MGKASGSIKASPSKTAVGMKHADEAGPLAHHVGDHINITIISAIASRWKQSGAQTSERTGVTPDKEYRSRQGIQDYIAPDKEYIAPDKEYRNTAEVCESKVAQMGEWTSGTPGKE